MNSRNSSNLELAPWEEPVILHCANHTKFWCFGQLQLQWNENCFLQKFAQIKALRSV